MQVRDFMKKMEYLSSSPDQVPRDNYKVDQVVVSILMQRKLDCRAF